MQILHSPSRTYGDGGWFSILMQSQVVKRILEVVIIPLL